MHSATFDTFLTCQWWKILDRTKIMKVLIKRLDDREIGRTWRKFVISPASWLESLFVAMKSTLFYRENLAWLGVSVILDYEKNVEK